MFFEFLAEYTSFDDVSHQLGFVKLVASRTVALTAVQLRRSMESIPSAMQDAIFSFWNTAVMVTGINAAPE